MAATLRASPDGLRKIDSARRQKGWNVTSSEWCKAAHTSSATLKRFRQLKPIMADTFINICQALGVNWEDVVDNNHKDVADNNSQKGEWYLVLSANFHEIDKQKVEALIDHLKQIAGDNITVTLKGIENESTPTD